MTTIQERIFSLIGKGELAEVARNCGIRESTLRSYKKSMPAADALVKITKGLNVNLLWLATGEGPMRPGEDQQVIVQQMMPASIGADFVLVPRLDVQASAGSGMMAFHEETVDFLAFQTSWLRLRHINPAYAQVITARGDSMEPTIRNGDLLLIDTSIVTAQDNALYIVVFDDMVVVKRVHRRMNGSILLISDNDRYPPEEVSANHVSNVHIAGRVVWFGRGI